MIGSIVNHPLFGRGQVLELRNAAREAAVRFDNGIRTIVQTNMLTALETTAKTAVAAEVVAEYLFSFRDTARRGFHPWIYPRRGIRARPGSAGE